MMLAKVVFPLLFAVIAVCDPHGHHWRAPKHTDRRSPCPGINALANHGYLPRDGRNVSLDQFITGIAGGLNFDTNFSIAAVDVYQNFTTTGHKGTLNLNDLNYHGVLGEFDGSLSRNDLFFGDNHSFNKRIWATTAAHFTNDTISIPTAAAARKARFDAAQAVNPYFTPSPELSLGTSALYLRAMRGQDTETRTEFVRIFFNEERIPFKEGYKRSLIPISNFELGQILEQLLAAT